MTQENDQPRRFEVGKTYTDNGFCKWTVKSRTDKFVVFHGGEPAYFPEMYRIRRKIDTLIGSGHEMVKTAWVSKHHEMTA